VTDTDTNAELQYLCIAPAFDGKRVDQVLAQLFPQYSRAYIQRRIKEGCILRNDKPCQCSDKVLTNDQVSITWPPEKTLQVCGEDLGLDVLAEEDEFLVINKPAGLVVHPAKGHHGGTLVHGLLHHDRDRFEALVDESLRPGIVHRLDKDTSGCMVIAKHEVAQANLCAAFAAREVEKTYLALVVGEFGAITGSIHTQFGRHPTNRIKMAVLAEGGKHAITHYRVLAFSQGISLLQIRIETGRTHQIRVHLAHLKHPVLGDSLYGGRHCDAEIDVQRQMLHAWRLAFPHPRTGIVREYKAPVPEDFRHILRQLQIPIFTTSTTQAHNIAFADSP